MSNGPQKVTDPIFVNPPPEGLLNNAAGGHFSGGPQNGRKMAGHAENGQISAIRPFARPFFAGHFQFRAHFPPVAGQRGRNITVGKRPTKKGKQPVNATGLFSAPRHAGNLENASS